MLSLSKDSGSKYVGRCGWYRSCVCTRAPLLKICAGKCIHAHLTSRMPSYPSPLLPPLQTYASTRTQSRTHNHTHIHTMCAHIHSYTQTTNACTHAHKQTCMNARLRIHTCAHKVREHAQSLESAHQQLHTSVHAYIYSPRHHWG